MNETNEPSVGGVEFATAQEQNSDTAMPSVPDGASKGSYAGSIANEIGTGEHAKDSFIWMTLKYCFYLGTILSAGMMIAYFHFVFDKNEPEKIDIIASLKDVWSIFTPILTLALGYAFGKRDRSD